MKKFPSRAVICAVLSLSAAASDAEPVDYTFSTNGPVFVDPLLTGLTAVSGSFTYDNGALPFATVPDGIVAGSTIYLAPSNLAGVADGNAFGDPQGSTVVGDEKYATLSPPTDILVVGWDGGPVADLVGFDFAGMPLTNVRFFWIEGQDGNGEFLEDQSLPAVLPPAASGRLSLDFTDDAGQVHFAMFSVTVVPALPADADLSFNGSLVNVDLDTGTGVYSGLPPGTEFFGSINRFTSEGFISDRSTDTPFGCCIAAGPAGLYVDNDYALEAEDAVLLTLLTGTDYVAGDIVDVIGIEGDAATAAGGRIEVGLAYVLDALAFSDESRDNYPPDPNDVLVTLFFIVEQDNLGQEIYSATGVVPDLLDADGDGIADSIDGTLDGVFNDQSTVFSNAFTDQHLGGATSGTIVNRNGNTLNVSDDPELGVILTAIGGTDGQPQQVEACTSPVTTIYLTNGDQTTVTCGSFTGDALPGPVLATVGGTISITIPTGAIAFIEALPGGVLSISHLGTAGDAAIVIEENGVSTNLGPTESPYVTVIDGDEDDDSDSDSDSDGDSDSDDDDSDSDSDSDGDSDSDTDSDKKNKGKKKGKKKGSKKGKKKGSRDGK